MLKNLRRALYRRQMRRRMRRFGYGEPLIERVTAHRTADNKLETVATLWSSAAPILADHFAKLYDDLGGPNFLIMTMLAANGRLIEITVAPRRPGALSPAEVISKLQHACDLAHGWFEEIYPDDIFTGESGDSGAVRVVEIREALRDVMKMRREEDREG